MLQNLKTKIYIYKGIAPNLERVTLNYYILIPPKDTFIYKEYGFRIYRKVSSRF